MTDAARRTGAIPEGGRRPRGGVLCVLLVSSAAAFVVGWPTRNGDFLRGDDHRLVLDHVYVNHPSLGHAWKLLTMVHDDLYQPLPMLTFQVDYALAGPDPAGRFPVSPFLFHLTNILLHALNAALACLMAWRLSARLGIALVTGVAFACHPFAIEPVAWITGRMILMAAAFSLMLITVCLYRRDRPRIGWTVSAVVVWLCALLSKVFPSVPIAAAWCDSRLHRRWDRRCRTGYAILLAMSVVGTWAAVAATREAGYIERIRAESTTSVPVRMLLASRYYFENTVWPAHLSAWSPPPDRVPLVSIDVALALFEWGIVLVLAGFAWRRSRIAFTGFVLFFTLIGPFLAATAARRFLTADRYMYLPIIGLHLAGAAGAVAVYDGLRRWKSARLASVLVAAPCLAVVVVWMGIDRDQAGVWSNIIAQAQRTMATYPDNPDVHVELIKAYLLEKLPDEAFRVIAETRRRWPDNPRLPTLAGEVYRLKRDWTRAAAELREAVQRRPHHARTWYHYGLTLEQLGRRAEARVCYRRILEEHDGYLPAATALARSCRDSGDIDAAIKWFERAVALNPHHRNALFDLADLMIRQRRWERARELLERILDFDPDDRPTAVNLAVVLTNLDRFSEALAVLDRRLTADPSGAAVRLNRAALFVRMQALDRAERDYRAVLSAEPAHREAAVGLHELLQHRRRYDQIVELWHAVRRAGGPNPETGAWLTWACVMAGQTDEARSSVASIAADTPLRAFAEWAFVWKALRERDFARLARLLDALPVCAPVGAGHRRRMRIALAALSDLPAEARKTAPGLYTLARALAFQGDRASAERVAEGVDDAGEWMARAQKLVRRLHAETTTTNTSVKDGSAPR